MKISWNWLSELVDLSAVGTPEKLGELLTSRGLEVEGISHQGAGLEKVVSVKILERNPHPQADRLSLCKVSLGSGDPLEIVCGAQNMKAGDVVCLAQIGAELPNGLKITQSKIRGVVSNGMLCSEEELRFKDKSEGILILPADTKLGRPLAEILGKNDTVLELSLTPNRGDCLSHWGIAREVAAATGAVLKSPVRRALEFSATSAEIETTVDGAGTTQFLAVAIDGVKVGPSPEWVVRKLEALDQRSINNVVDCTNLVMFELGQPTHAYDASMLKGRKLSGRQARQGEKLPLLDGTTVELRGTEAVIADEAQPVALAGVMGGGNSEVRDSTTKIILECAEFHPVFVRKAAHAHQKHTEASHRFERGVDGGVLPIAMTRLADLITELAGGKITASVRSGVSPKAREILTSTVSLEEFLGMPVPSAVSILKSLGFGVTESSGRMRVTVPSWRNDVSIPEDLAEELARSIGFDAIPSTIPKLSGPPTASGADPDRPQIEMQRLARETMASAGLCETVHYGFTNQAWLKELGFEGSIRVMNPLSEETEVMAPSLLPGLVKAAIANWNTHFGSESLAIRLFELRPTFHFKGERVQALSETDTGTAEHWKLSFALAGPKNAAGLKADLADVDFADVKAIVESLLARLQTRGVRVQPDAGHALFHPGQSAKLVVGDRAAGMFGRVHPRVEKALKLRGTLWLCEIDFAQLCSLSKGALEPRAFKDWPKFPGMERDFALVVDDAVAAERVLAVAQKAGKPLLKTARVFDIYRGAPIAAGKTSIAVRVQFADETRSLQEAEVEAVCAKILAEWKKELSAELR
jgi:phenylalanyl-tRNA synthetase beta chain